MKKKRFEVPERSGREAPSGPQRPVKPPNGRPTRANSDERRDREPAAGLLFGVLPVLEALRSNPGRIDKIFVADTAKEHRLAEITALAREHCITLNRLEREKFSRIAPADVNTQGVIAYASPVNYADAEELIEAAGDASLFLILDGIEDPRNLGAVIRSAECAGVSGIFIPERRAVGLTETVAKSSAGAVEYAKVAKVANISRLIERLKKKNIWVVGTSSGTAERSYSDWDWKRPSAIVLGSEGSGLHRLVAENCDMLVKIPMYGKIDSLNVSVAAGVILFEARRQRNTEE
ncbi:MAG: 23S rRNA (guanosine(2251)-2'-O)-methyltransferase RlmB [Pyrinomonadaceae bacterium]